MSAVPLERYFTQREPTRIQEITDRVREFGDVITSHPLMQRSMDIVKSISPAYRLEQRRYTERTLALEDLQQFVSVLEDPTCTIKADITDPNTSIVKLGIHTEGDVATTKIGEIYVTLPTNTHPAEATLYLPNAKDEYNQPLSSLTLSASTHPTRTRVIQQGKIFHQWKEKDTFYFLTPKTALEGADMTYTDRYTYALQHVLSKLLTLGNEAATKYIARSPQQKASAILFQLADAAWRDSIRTHKPIWQTLQSTQEVTPRVILTHQQTQFIKEFSEEGWRAPHMSELKNPHSEIISAAMRKKDGIAHYVVVTADNTFICSGKENLIPGYANGVVRMIDPSTKLQDLSVLPLAAANIPISEIQEKLLKIGERLRQEAKAQQDLKAIHTVDETPGRVRSIPHDLSAQPTQITNPNITQPIALADLFSPPEENHPASASFTPHLLEIPSFLQEEETPYLSLVSSSTPLPPVPRPSNEPFNFTGKEPQLVRPFTLAEVDEFLKHQPDELPLILLGPTHISQRKLPYIDGITLVNAPDFHRTIKKRFRTLGDFHHLSPLPYEQPLPPEKEELLERKRIRRPLQEHRQTLLQAA